MNQVPNPADMPGRPTRVADPGATDPRVQDALGRLGECHELPLDEQVQVYADIQRRLAEILADPAAQG